MDSEIEHDPGLLLVSEWHATPECEPITIYIDNEPYQVRKPWVIGSGGIAEIANKEVAQLVCREIGGRDAGNGHIIDGRLVDLGRVERVHLTEGDRFLVIALRPGDLGWS